MDERFAALRRQHEGVLEALGRLETCLPAKAAGGASPRLLSGVAAFLESCEVTLRSHIEDEEREIYPLLERYLPEEVGSAAAMQREHETALSLVNLLRRDLGLLRAGDTELAPAMVAAARDLVVLLRDHIRKEDEVVAPLLQRLLRGGHHG